MKCIICKTEFEGRSDAKFCSPSCRVKHARNLVTDNPSVTDNVTDNSSWMTKEKMAGYVASCCGISEEEALKFF